jgi:hypothetical protein
MLQRGRVLILDWVSCHLCCCHPPQLKNSAYADRRSYPPPLPRPPQQSPHDRPAVTKITRKGKEVVRHGGMVELNGRRAQITRPSFKQYITIIRSVHALSSATPSNELANLSFSLQIGLAATSPAALKLRVRRSTLIPTSTATTSPVVSTRPTNAPRRLYLTSSTSSE